MNKTMEYYTITLSKLQTEIAASKGAPLQHISIYDRKQERRAKAKADMNNGIYRFVDGAIIVYKRPSAEQVCGWLRENGIHLYAYKKPDGYGFNTNFICHEQNATYPSYEAAMLKAIDIALEII